MADGEVVGVTPLDDEKPVDDVYSEESILRRQKKEKRELQAKITNMKHNVAKSDRVKKKELTNEIARLEADLATRHQQELNEFRKTQSLNEIPLDETSENAPVNCEDVSEAKEDRDESVQQMDKRKLTKAQKRRDKKESKSKETERVIAESEAQARGGARYQEYEAFSKVLAAKGLSFHPIPADGDCLYKALAHQLSLCGSSVQVNQLRQQAAEVMKSNEDDYFPFLTNRDGESLSQEEFQDYCVKLLKPGVWGGHPELVALSSHYQRPIEVLQASAASLVIGEQYLGRASPLVITYHRHAFSLGEHYNSTQPKLPSTENAGDDVANDL